MAAEDVAEHCAELAETHGVRAMKLKAGVMEPGEEARVLELCRASAGRRFRPADRPQRHLVDRDRRAHRPAPGGPGPRMVRGPVLGDRGQYGGAQAGAHPDRHQHGAGPLGRSRACHPPGRGRRHPDRCPLLGGSARREGALRRLPHLRPGRRHAQRPRDRRRDGGDAAHRLDHPGDDLLGRRPLSSPRPTTSSWAG